MSVLCDENGNRNVIEQLLIDKRGIGDSEFSFAVYIENQPPMDEYQQLNEVIALKTGEISRIGQVCGNGWRKVFNVYAKLLYALDSSYFNFSSFASSWQQYRDQYLLQSNSQTALLFSSPELISSSDNNVIHIICGRIYAKKLLNEGQLAAQFLWLNEEFAIDIKQKIIICPYFDYRQLSNIKIDYLASLLRQFRAIS